MKLCKDCAQVGEGETALQQCHAFREQQFEGWIDAIKAGTATQAEIDAVTDHYRRIAYERGYLRRDENGAYALRTQAASEGFGGH